MLSHAGGRYRVWMGNETVEASLRGRLKQSADDRIIVGDRVRIATGADGSMTIEAVLPRRSVLKRRSPGKMRGVRDVAANLDQVVVVGAACDPDWDPYLMDRFTAVAEANALSVTVVINKIDLDGNATALGAPYRGAGYPVLLTSARERIGLADLARRLEGQVSLFTGPTGVGKSSLLNALQPGLALRTGPVGTRSRGGRHTTVAAEMHPFAPVGFVVDTPGLRDIGLWGLRTPDVSAAFPELASYRAACRFDNCRHLEEPDCAVRLAVESGAMSASRWESYCRLLTEAERAARPWA